MRLSLRRIVAHRPDRQTGNCIRCERISPPIARVLRSTFLFQYRGYADNVEDSGSKDTSPALESTGTVPDTITAESFETQQPQSQTSPPNYPSFSSPGGAKTISKRKPKVSNKAEGTAKSDVMKAFTQTTLRKKIVWEPPLRGINPAYDMALEILAQDREQKIKVIDRLEKRLERERERFPHTMF